MPDPRAVHDPAAHRGRRRRPAAGARLPRRHRQRRLRVVGLDDAVRDALDGGRALPRARPSASTRRSPTRTTPTRARCAATAISSRRSPSSAQMDDLAERLGLDPLELRRRNVTQPGDVNPQGFAITSCAMPECLDALAERSRRRAAAGRRAGSAASATPGMFHVGGRRAHLPLRRLRRHREARRLRQGLADHRRHRDRPGLGDRARDDRGRDARRAARARGRRQLRHRRQAVGRRRPREPDHVHRRQRRAPGRGEAARAAARAWPPTQLETPARAARRAQTAGSSSRDEPAAPAPVRPRGARPGTSASGGRRWWPRRSTIRRRPCSTRTSAATCRPPTASPPRRRWSTSTRRPAGSRCVKVASAHDVGRALNPLAAEGQIHGGIHMGLGYALSERLVVERGPGPDRRPSWTTRSSRPTTCRSSSCGSSRRSTPRGPSAPRASASPA